MYNKMTMEVILATAFGRAVDVQNGKGGRILESAVKIFGTFATEGEHSSRIARVLNFMASELSYILFLKDFSSNHVLTIFCNFYWQCSYTQAYALFIFPL